MKKKCDLILTALFSAFLGVFLLLAIILPDRSFSEAENRSLQELPRFSFYALRTGRFTEAVERYVADQFPLRDSWTGMKARLELLSGKKENNGIYLCENDLLLEPFTAPNDAEIAERIDIVNTFSDSSDVPVYFALIPGKSGLYPDSLPAGVPNDDQEAVIAMICARCDAKTIDLCTPLTAHRSEDLFYRTDHHWTTLGAWYGYSAIADCMGFDPIPISAYEKRIVSDTFYGTMVSSSGFRFVAPDSISTYVEAGGETITNYPSGSPVPGTLYDGSYLDKKDKYSYFYGGNTPLLTVETGNEGPRVLILRDSFADSLTPYLFPHCSELHIMDLRYYRSGVQKYLAEHEIDSILICYNLDNFLEDANLFLMNY